MQSTYIFLNTVHRNNQCTDRESGGCGSASLSVRLSPLGLNIVHHCNPMRYSWRALLFSFSLARCLFSKQKTFSNLPTVLGCCVIFSLQMDAFSPFPYRIFLFSPGPHLAYNSKKPGRFPLGSRGNRLGHRMFTQMARMSSSVAGSAT